MNDKNTKKLMDDFPFLSNRYNQFGEVECGDGWFPTVYLLCANIEKINNDLFVSQIKEKYAELRFYYYCGETMTRDQDDEIEALIEEATEKLTSVCEECGQGAEISQQGNWLVCLCSKHLVHRLKKLHK